jgi:succinate dehydrogenase/fumarate reductase flavoprotein subunit
LSGEAAQYLQNTGALQATPIERLAQLNQPAIDLYLSNGIDLQKEPLEIAVCAQHNNGGLKADIWWESNIRHLFPVGEINGTHGIYRPGGSALNAGQVGGIRAAMKISMDYPGTPPDLEEFRNESETSIKSELNLLKRFKETGLLSLEDCQEDIRRTMADCASHIRSYEKILKVADNVNSYLKHLPDKLQHQGKGINLAYRTFDMAIAQFAYLESIKNLIEKGIGSRGSYLIINSEGDNAHSQLEPDWKFLVEKEPGKEGIQEIYFDGELNPHIGWVKSRPIPTERHWFETLWKRYRDKD